MNTHLPADLEQFLQAKVRSGRFSSSDEAMAAAVRLLRQQGRSRGSPRPGGHPPRLGRHAGRTDPGPGRSVCRHPPRPESAPGFIKYRVELAATAKMERQKSTRGPWNRFPDRFFVTHDKSLFRNGLHHSV